MEVSFVFLSNCQKCIVHVQNGHYDMVYHVKASGMQTNCIRVTHPLQSVTRSVMHTCRLDTIMYVVYSSGMWMKGNFFHILSNQQSVF